MFYPVQRDIIVEILGVLLASVYNYGWDEALPISLGKYK